MANLEYYLAPLLLVAKAASTQQKAAAATHLLLLELLLNLFSCFCVAKSRSRSMAVWPTPASAQQKQGQPCTNFLWDRYLKPWIIPVPEVTIVPRAKDDECLILASDGLWDVMSNEEACSAARKRILLWHKKNGVPLPSTEQGELTDPAAQAAAEYLSKLALQKGSKDNVTVIVVDLKAHRKFRSRS